MNQAPTAEIRDRTVTPAVFSETGRLTTGAAEQLGLSQEQVHRVNDLVAKNNKAFEAALGQRSKLNENESVPEKQVTVYDIAALEDRGQQLLDKFKGELIGELGSEAGKKLHQMFMDSPGAKEMYGGYGRYDTKVKFSPVDQSDEAEISAHYVYTDPQTGKWVLRSEATLDSFQEKFGSTFSFEPEPK